MKKYLDIVLINSLYLIIGIVLFYVLEKRTEILGAVIATGISLSLGIRQYKTENDKIFKELFQEFNSKYDMKFSKKLSEISKNNHVENTEIVIEYFNFCAEEYLWKTKGRIPDNVWISWERASIFFISNEVTRKIFDSERNQKKSYYGWYERIEKKLKILESGKNQDNQSISLNP